MKGASRMGFVTRLLFLWVATCLILSSFTVAGQEICTDEITKPEINTAIWEVNNNLSSDILISMQTEECWQCDLVTKYRVSAGGRCHVRVDTRWPMNYTLSVVNVTDLYCQNSFHFQEDGIFNTEVVTNENGSQILCSKPALTNNPANSFDPIFIALGTLVGIYLLISAFYHLKNSTIFRRIFSRFTQESLIEADLGSPDSINPADDTESFNNHLLVKERLKSLDAFRGISIVIMIFVNYGGGRYWFFEHSPWNGLTVADIVFPWFIFIMGTSMAYSFRSMLRRGMKKRSVLKKILVRTVVLFCLGIMLNCFSIKDIDVTTMRIPGVLQRFAITYFIVGLTHMFSAKAADPHQFVWWTPIQEVVIYWPDWVVSITLLVIYISVTFGVKLSQCGRGYIGPAGLSNHSYLNETMCVGGVASYIDRAIFTESHIYKRGTFRDVYHSQGYHDPEGILGCLTSCVLCSLGLEAGKIFLMYRPTIQRVKRFVVWAVLLGSAALILTYASKENGWMPINKNLWSVSFIFATGSLAYLMLIICYLTIDVWKVWSGSPFYWAGMNAIALYLGHELLSKKFPVHWQISHNDHWHRFLMDLWGVIFWILVAGMNAIALYLGHSLLAQRFPVRWQINHNDHWHRFLMDLWGVIFWILVAGFLHYKKFYFSI